MSRACQYRRFSKSASSIGGSGYNKTKPDGGAVGTEDDIESEADSVLGPKRPVVANIEGCPNLLPLVANPEAIIPKIYLTFEELIAPP